MSAHYLIINDCISLNNQSDTPLYTDDFKNKAKNVQVETRRKRLYMGLFHIGKPYNLSNKL